MVALEVVVFHRSGCVPWVMLGPIAKKVGAPGGGRPCDNRGVTVVSNQGDDVKPGGETYMTI
jgi:hypothetical protein